MSIRRTLFPCFTALGLALLCQACEGPSRRQPPPPAAAAAPPLPPAIRILPLGRAPQAMVQVATEELRKVFPDVKALPAEAMPAQAWHPGRNRWRADTLIGWMGGRAGAGEVYLGITTDDISATKDDFDDFGIMGLAQMPGRACVASSRRVKDKAQFPKVVIHELGHTAGLPHCPEPRCLMRAANGKDHTAEIDAFCPRCRGVLRRQGWRI